MRNKLLYDNYLLHQVHELVMQVAFFSLLIPRNLHQTYQKKIFNYCSLLLERCCGLVVAKLATEPAAKMLRSSFQKHTTSYLELHIRILKATLQNKFKKWQTEIQKKKSTYYRILTPLLFTWSNENDTLIIMISSVILLTVCHTVLVMLVWRVWINL